MMPIHEADTSVDTEFGIVPSVEPEDVLGDSLGLNRDYEPLIDTDWSEADRTTGWEREKLEELSNLATDAPSFEELVKVLEDEDYENAHSVDERLFGLDFGVAGLALSLGAVGLVPFYSCRGHEGYAIDRIPQVGLFGDVPRLTVLAGLARTTGCGVAAERSGVWVLGPTIAHLNNLARAVLDATEEFERCGSPPWRAEVDRINAAGGLDYQDM